jgi:hypothetical protein
MSNKPLAIVALGMLIGSTAGHAVPISHTLDITATDFVLSFWTEPGDCSARGPDALVRAMPVVQTDNGTPTLPSSG